MRKFSMGLICTLGLLMIMSGCISTRNIVDIKVPPAPDSTGKKSVQISRVTDVRSFELRPRTASIPSLKDGKIHDKAITSRAMARMRNGYGKALGDVILPEGRTVEDLVYESIQTALREKGYTVIEGSDPERNGVITLEANIHQFWAWSGFQSSKYSMEFEAIIEIKSRITRKGSPEKIHTRAAMYPKLATNRAWQNTITKGIENLIAAVKAGVKKP